LRPGHVIARSAGTFAQLMARDGKYTIKMPSGETRLILLTSATIELFLIQTTSCIW
jgi:large subunit ribosomal protein L2